MWFKSLSLTADGMRVTVAADSSGPQEHVSLVRDQTIFDSEGSPLCSADALAHQILQGLGPDHTMELMRDATGAETRFEVTLDFATQPQQLFLQRISSGELRHILELTVFGPAAVEVAEIPLAPHRIEGTDYVAGSATTVNYAVTLVASTANRENNGRYIIRSRRSRPPSAGAEGTS